MSMMVLPPSSPREMDELDDMLANAMPVAGPIDPASLPYNQRPSAAPAMLPIPKHLRAPAQNLVADPGIYAESQGLVSAPSIWDTPQKVEAIDTSGVERSPSAEARLSSHGTRYDAKGPQSIDFKESTIVDFDFCVENGSSGLPDQAAQAASRLSMSTPLKTFEVALKRFESGEKQGRKRQMQRSKSAPPKSTVMHLFSSCSASPPPSSTASLDSSAETSEEEASI